MIPPPTPANEDERIQALLRLKILDTPPEDRFDRLTRLAKEVFRVPIAFISLVDSERQWFKSCHGMSLIETPRDISFCGHTILGDRALVVQNALDDIRFNDNPLVMSGPQFRFYAGHPLRSPDGHNIGTLCIADRMERAFSQEERQLLGDLASLAENELHMVKLVDLQEELHALLQTLDEKDQENRILLETISDGIVSIDDMGTILHVNNVAAQMFGYDPQELVGKNLDILVPEYLRQLHRNGLQHYNATGTKHLESWQSVALPGLHREGHEIPLEISFGEIIILGRRRFTGLLRDVTRQRQDYRELQAATNAAEQALASRTSFFARMSHEIRTPMNGVVGLINVLSETALSSEQQHLVENLTKSAHHLSSIANDILDLSKMEAGQIHLLEVDLSLRSVLQRIVESLTPTAKAQGTALSLQIDSALPETLVGDPVRLSQIVLNLASNAVKFTDTGSVIISARTLKATNHSLFVELKVTDTGIGIPKEDLPTLFDAYTQAHRGPLRHYGGTGLGLAIVKQLVDLHGGSVSIESVVGTGTTVTVCLPFGIPSPETSVTPIEADLQGQVNLTRKRILIIEDDAINQLVAKKTVERFGATSWEAFSAVDGLEMLRREHFDLVLMDVQMPGMDGVEATRVIRNEYPPPLSQIPIVAMTASVMDTERERCLQAGMNDHVPKPFEPSALYAAMSRALGKSPISNPHQPTRVSADSAGDEPINLSYLHSISAQDDSFVRVSSKVFIRENRDNLRSLRDAVSRRDLAMVLSLAHKMKPSFRMFGLRRSSAVLDTMEHNARTNSSPDALLDLVAELQDRYERTCRELIGMFPSLEQDTQ